jgi:hypothetical protein
MPEHDKKSDPSSIFIIWIHESIFNCAIRCVSLAITKDIVTETLSFHLCFTFEINL